MMEGIEMFTRAATDEERAVLKLPTDEEMREALAEGERHRAAVGSLEIGVLPDVLFTCPR
jgi:hypothetical protein